MPAAVVVPLIASVVGAAGSLAASSMTNKNDVSDAMDKQRNVEISQQNEQAARDRRSQIREARIQRAMVENTAGAINQGGGSAAIVGGQQATAQAGQNIGAINTASSFASTLGEARQGVVDAQNKGTSPFSTLLGGIGQTIMNTGLEATTKSIFTK